MSDPSVHQIRGSKPIRDAQFKASARIVTIVNSCLNDPNHSPDSRLAILELLAEEVEKVYPQLTQLAN
jgi:hypothetical protein